MSVTLYILVLYFDFRKFPDGDGRVSQGKDTFSDVHKALTVTPLHFLLFHDSFIQGESLSVVWLYLYRPSDIF